MKLIIPFLSLFTMLPLGHAASDKFWNICANPSFEGVTRVSYKFSLPRGGSKAGNFTIVERYHGKQVRSAIDCGMACCDATSCHVALFRRLHSKPRCFLLTCLEDRPEACDPVSHEDDKRFRDAIMIRLRRLAPRFVERLCSPDSPKASCPKGELCEPNKRDGAYVCICPPGQKRLPAAKSRFGLCEPHRPSPTAASEKLARRACEFGTEQCGANEVCRVEGRLKKNGMCECREGFHRDEKGGCSPSVSVNATASPGTSGTLPSPTLPASPSPTSSPPSSSSSPSSRHGKVSSTVRPTKSSQHKVAPKKPAVRKLDILVSRNLSIQLPVNELTLSAKIKDHPKDSLTYLWSLLSNPDGSEGGLMEGKATPKLHLSKLIAGDYRFKLVVQGRHSYGEANVAVSVQPAKRINQPPIARVKSASEVVQLPNSLVLDGTQSSDDDKIASFKWEEVSGPLNQNDLKTTNNGILELKSLTPGDYVFKLTVTDSDGASNSTNVNVTVKKARDFFPNANAGQNVVLNLPNNHVTLYGNASTDDHGIKTYEWVKVGNDKLTADMTGVREPILRLKNLEKGDYVFELKVTDTAGQVSTAQVKVYVHAKQNTPPTPKAGGDRTVTLPLRIATLDGSKSEDDEKIVRFEWTQISGPHTLTLKDASKAKARVSNLKEGVYKFRLTAWDKEGLHNVDTMQLTVQESENQRPKASAGGDQLVRLPSNLVRLDGSKSWDDKQIVSYAWTRADHSLAAGMVLNNSDRQMQLLLSGLEPGKYVFKLTVKDAEGLQSSDSASLVVKSDSNLKNVLEMRFRGNMQQFKQSNMADLMNQLKLLLTKDFPNGDIRIHVEQIRQIHSSESLLLRFFVSKKIRSSEEVLEGKSVLRVLRQRLRSGVALLDLAIDRLDTAVCQASCSGHGKCNVLTGRCVCEAFWMENHLRVRYGDGEHNCDWSILYVIILACLGVLFIAAFAWFIVFCRRRRSLSARLAAGRFRRKVMEQFAKKYAQWRENSRAEESSDAEARRRWRRPRAKRSHKYALLGEFDEKNGGLKLASFPQRNGKSKSRRGDTSMGNGGPPGLLGSESDLSSDEENTLFVNKRPVSAEAKALHRANGEAGSL